MEFRYTPQQKGLYRQGKIPRGKGGGGELYEAKDLVKDSEVSKMKNSTVTPYKHKGGGSFSKPPESEERFGMTEAAIASDSARRAETDRAIREGTREIIIRVDGEAPKEYNAEKRPGIFERLAGIFKSNDEKKREHALDRDKDGKPLFKENIINEIKDKLERRRKERQPLELQWQLNSNFYDGNQYCDINIGLREIKPYAVCDSEEGASREVFNRIAPLIETRVANLKKVNYAMEVKSATNELEDFQKAKISTAILRNTQEKSGFNAKKDALILWNEICGSCFWLTWWDASKGEEYARFVEEYHAPDGRVSRIERAVYEGDVDYGLLTPYEVYPESIYRQSVAEQGSVIVEQVLSVEKIKNLYGIEVDGEEVDTFNLTPQPGAGGLGYEATVVSLSKAKMENCKKVITFFERRTKEYPEGRMAILIGEDKLAYYGPMPYDDIPIIRTVCKERSGQFFGKSVIEDLIPLQRAYNTACNDIADYLKKAKSSQWLVLEDSVDIDDFANQANLSDAILVYKNPNYPPIRQSAVAFSGDVFKQKYDLENQMEYVAAVSQLMVYGQTPSGVTSGTAIESLRDIDNTRLALTGDYIRNAVIEMAKHWLHMYKRFAGLYRVIQNTGLNDIGAALVWNSDDITSYDVSFTTENELLLSETSQWQRILQLLQSGITDERLLSEASEKAREFIKSGAYNSEITINELQTQNAARENQMLTMGVFPSVNEYDNHNLHAEEHLKFILQAEFKLLERENPAMAEAMVEHWKAHRAIIEQNMMAAQMQAQQTG